MRIDDILMDYSWFLDNSRKSMIISENSMDFNQFFENQW
jgi:hypothetical protein